MTADPARIPYVMETLFVCPGDVSNAPATDRLRRVVAYEPVMRVRGVPLLRAPVDGCVSSGFGVRTGGRRGFHQGVDLYTRRPAPIRAAGDGVVTDISTQRGYGLTILVRHRNNVMTRYAHLSAVAPAIRRGRRVFTGDVLGRTGMTGNAMAVHLHYEVIVGDRPLDPLLAGASS